MKLIRPVREPHKVTSPYGWRMLNGEREFHPGIDYINQNDDRAVLAIADGDVCLDVDYYQESLRWTDNRHSAGNYVIIKHTIESEIYYCRYLHLLENYVTKGQHILQGAVIGTYADVGRSYGAHLHFDMFNEKWAKIDPTPILTKLL